jgi:hypothetical protein
VAIAIPEFTIALFAKAAGYYEAWAAFILLLQAVVILACCCYEGIIFYSSWLSLI